MKLSVCLFTYNHKDFIVQTIEGVLMQRTNFDFEIVIGEDCSTDGTREIVAAYQHRYPQKIRAFLNEKNLGVMDNNIQTLRKCDGEYIALLDGDDYWTSADKLQLQVDFLDQNRNFMFCFHDAAILNLNLRINEQTCCGPHQKKIVSVSDIICDTHIPTSSLVFRKAGLKAFPPKNYNHLKAPDRPLFLMLADSGPGFYFNEQLSVYRKHPGGDWTAKNFQNQWLVHLQIHNFMDHYFSKRHHKSFCRCESQIAYLLAIGLIYEGRFDRAKCYIRKFLMINGGLFARPDVYFKVINFYLVLLRFKLSSSQ